VEFAPVEPGKEAGISERAGHFATPEGDAGKNGIAGGFRLKEKATEGGSIASIFSLKRGRGGIRESRCLDIVY